MKLQELCEATGIKAKSWDDFVAIVNEAQRIAADWAREPEDEPVQISQSRVRARRAAVEEFGKTVTA